jgi:hypothetical protein
VRHAATGTADAEAVGPEDGIEVAEGLAEIFGDGAPELVVGLGEAEAGTVVGEDEAPGPVRNPPGRSPNPTATMRTAARSVAKTRWLRIVTTGRRDLRSIAASIRCVNATLTGRGSIAR